ncbi:type VI secretion system contractile sheath domain-containing protein [Burkholderia ambifaria]|uniref:type VI secretion system contractile sheath domain-containing protein n=1 Tax=Burkholderia ambifaria TaxID=152480 RepID=UPI00158D4FE2|nr:type VI secretion system contractile sheath large subunit [Burkholderia ambifaria]
MKSTETQHAGTSETVVLDAPHGDIDSVYASLCSKINLKPVSEARPLEAFRDNDMLSEASADERIARGMGAFLELVANASQPVDRLDKSLLDFHIGQIDRQISRQLDAVMHTQEFQALEARWRGLKMLVSRTDFRKNARIEVLDVSKDALQRDFEDTPELIQSGLYRLTYIEEYDTPGGQPISAMISDFEFANSPMDVALLRNISKVAAAAHMPFIGSVGPAFFGKQSNLGFIPLSFYKNHDFACFFSANSAQKPALYETREATANSRINARLPYIFLLSRIAHYLKLIQRENIGTTKDRRLLELELNNWIKGLVTEMKDPGDELQASHPLREAKVTVEDIEDNPGFFRIKLFIVPHFQVEGMDIGLSLVSQMPKSKN